MAKRPITFAQALAQVRKRDAPPLSLNALEAKSFDLLDTHVAKLQRIAKRAAREGQTFSPARLDTLREAVALLDEIDAAGAEGPLGVETTVNIMKAAALVAAATEGTDMVTVTNLRKRAAETLDQLAERLRGPGETHAAAVAKALSTAEGADAYERYDAGRQRGEAPEFAAEPVAKGVDSPAWARIVMLADELVQKSAQPMTREAARNQVMEWYPELYEMYLHERRNRG